MRETAQNGGYRYVRTDFAYLFRTRVASCVAFLDNRNPAFTGLLRKPSDGLEPSTPSLPWRFRGVTRVHPRSLPTHFSLQIKPSETLRMRRETSRVSFLMCPFCVRAWVPSVTTRRRASPCNSAPRGCNRLLVPRSPCRSPLNFEAVPLYGRRRGGSRRPATLRDYSSSGDGSCAGVVLECRIDGR